MPRQYSIRVGAVAAIVCAVLIAFQNCSGGQFHSALVPVANTSLTANPPNILSLITPQSAIAANVAFTVIADQSGYPAGTTTFLWETDFSDGLIFCDETTSIDASTSSIVCPENGVATVSITVTVTNADASTTVTNYSLTVNVGPVSSTGPVLPPPTSPSPSPSSSPMPSPSPTTMPLAADAMLYNNECASCHGSLPGGSDRMGITLAQLQNALATQPAMAFLNGELTAAQQQEIVNALNGK